MTELPPAADRTPTTSRMTVGAALVGMSGMLVLFGCGPEPIGGDWSSREQSVRVAPPPPPQTLTLMRAGTMRDNALTLLLAASEAPSPLLRANAIEAFNAAPSEARMSIQRALGDPNRGVRFVAVMSVGLMELHDLAPLLEPLLQDEHASVRAAAIFALTRSGRAVDPTPLASMIRSDDPEVRGNAAMVLGELGNRSAVPLLQSVIGRGMMLRNPAMVRIVELQIAEALVKLGEASAIEPIRAAMFAPPEQAELVVLACQIVGRLEDRMSVAFLRQLVAADGLDRRPAEIRLAAAAALGRMGEGTPDLLAVAMEHVNDPIAERRAQAVATLGQLRDRRGTEAAARALADRDPMVQVAAAGSVLRLTD